MRDLLCYIRGKANKQSLALGRRCTPHPKPMQYSHPQLPAVICSPLLAQVTKEWIVLHSFDFQRALAQIPCCENSIVSILAKAGLTKYSFLSVRHFINCRRKTGMAQYRQRAGLRFSDGIAISSFSCLQEESLASRDAFRVWYQEEKSKRERGRKSKKSRSQI